MIISRLSRYVRGMQGALLLGTLFTLIFLGLITLHQQHRLEQEIVSRQRLEHVISKLPLASSLLNNNQAIVKDPLLSSSFDDVVVIYNRVPKTASTSFAGIAYALCSRNHFNVLHLNVTHNSHVISVPDQMRFVYNVTRWHAKKPAFYHGHLAYLDFARFGAMQRPLYINIIRNPLDRLISYYYFLRNGDDFRPHLKRKRSGDKMTFDECIAWNHADCAMETLWLQIPFMCGQAAECWHVGSEWALETAKFNLVNNYLLVGITEELGDFVAVLEATLPRMFAGAMHLYNSGQKSHLRKTFNKIEPSDETIMRVKESQIWRMENEFYEFARKHFHFIKKRTFDLRNGQLEERKQQFIYEKIRPK